MSKGHSLIEVLIVGAIFSFTLFSSLRFALQSLQATQNAHYFSTATTISHGLAEYFLQQGIPVSESIFCQRTEDPQCTGTCNDSLQQWNQQLQQLPDAIGKIQSGSNQLGEYLGIKVYWSAGEYQKGEDPCQFVDRDQQPVSLDNYPHRVELQLSQYHEQ